MQTGNLPVLIDLSRDLVPESIESTQLIHYHCVNKLEHLVRACLPDEKGSNKVHNKVFFIDGTRGAGKSTFLQAMARHFERIACGLCPLATIDPTLLETGEQHIFFSILAQLKSKVEAKQHHGGSWDQENSSYEDWRRALQALARGAMLLNGRGGNEAALDDLLGMDESLFNAKSGMQLRTAFHKLLDLSADILQVQGFILAFDDVDTHFEKGWQVLELIRRYLQSPRLVVLITGDLQLYTHLVRSQQFKHLGRELFEQDRGREKERGALVDHLEQQYLMKVFPLQNRVHLSPLAVLLDEDENARDRQHVRPFQLRTANGDRELSSYVDQMVKEGFLIHGSQQAEPYRDLLLNLPIRAVLQILRNYQHSSAPSKPLQMAEALRGTLMGSLYKMEVDIDALSHAHQGKLIEAVFDAVIHDGEMDTGIYLRPQPADETIRNVYFALSAEVAAQCDQHPERALRYLLAGLGSVSLLQKGRPDGASLSSNSEYVMQFKKKLSIGRQEDGLNWARYAAPILLNVFDNNAKIGAGILKLSLDKGGFDAILQNGTLPEVQQIAFRIACHHVEASGLRMYMSIFNLLAAMERLLLLRNLGPQAMETEVAALLSRLASRITVTAPAWLAKSGARLDAEGGEAEQPADENTGKFVRECLPRFCAWLKEAQTLSSHIHPSALFLGKVWPRLYFSLAKVAQHQQKMGAGALMHMFAICLVNAFLIEEQDHHYCDSQGADTLPRMPRDNPVNSASTLFNKILSLQTMQDGQAQELQATLKKFFPFTTLILRCPLISAFIFSAQGNRSLSSQNQSIANLSLYGDQLERQAAELGTGLNQLDQARILNIELPKEPERKRKPRATSSTSKAAAKPAAKPATKQAPTTLNVKDAPNLNVTIVPNEENHNLPPNEDPDAPLKAEE